MPPDDLTRFCEAQLAALAPGIGTLRVVSGEVGAAKPTAAQPHPGLDVLIRLLCQGCSGVVVTVRTCLGQRCSVMKDTELRTSHFAVVTDVWRTAGGQVLVVLNDPACNLHDDLEQVASLANRRATGSAASSRRSMLIRGKPKGCLAASSIRGNWEAEAGRYAVDWDVFDLVWNSKPDGKDRWWMAVVPDTSGGEEQRSASLAT